jgi:hypothetical protein
MSHRPPSTTSDINRDYVLDGKKAAWRQAEEWICDRMGWDEVDESTHDAVDGEIVCRYGDNRTHEIVGRAGDFQAMLGGFEA